MAGAAYDVHPYVLMNYTDNYESVTTLAHEWGHAMHSYLSNQAQPFVTSDYATFVAEIASTCNEALLLEHVLKIAKSDDERLLYLGSALEGLRGTFFRQAMFAEFERDVHARVDKGESLTGEALTKIYGDILRRYHGDAEGVVKIDDLYTVEWAYIPHFYTSVLRVPVRHLDRRELALRRRDPQGRARRARALPQAPARGQLGLPLRAGEGRRRRPRHARALPRARRRA